MLVCSAYFRLSTALRCFVAIRTTGARLLGSDMVTIRALSLPPYLRLRLCKSLVAVSIVCWLLIGYWIFVTLSLGVLAHQRVRLRTWWLSYGNFPLNKDLYRSTRQCAAPNGVEGHPYVGTDEQQESIHGIGQDVVSCIDLDGHSLLSNTPQYYAPCRNTANEFRAWTSLTWTRLYTTISRIRGIVWRLSIALLLYSFQTTLPAA